MAKDRIGGPEVVGGVEFQHGFNAAQEFYDHRDARGWGWGVFRNKLGGGEYDETWYAYVQPKDGPWAVLNTGGPDDATATRKGPLYDLDSYDYRALLGGLVPLIKAGAYPEEIVTKREEVSST